VLDQTLKNNSSISFINTSVMRSGIDYDANVTAGLWDFYDKKNNWNFSGKFAVSQLYGYEAPNKTTVGTEHSVNFSKTGGRFNFNVWQELASDKYEQNDMGYFTNNNYLDNGIWVGYKWIKPKGIYNRMYLNFNGYYSRRYMPGDYQSMNINVNINGQLKNLWYVGLFTGYNANGNDFYEPRIDGRVFKAPASWVIDAWFNTNEAKNMLSPLKLLIEIHPGLKGTEQM